MLIFFPRVSTETGPPGPDERGESLPQSHGRHAAGETAQSALGKNMPPNTQKIISNMYFPLENYMNVNVSLQDVFSQI